MKKILSAIIIAVLSVGCLVMLSSCSPSNTFHTYENEEMYTLSSGFEIPVETPISRINVYWACGEINLLPSNGGYSFEENEGSGDLQMRYLLDGDTLNVQFCKGGYDFGDTQKNLTIKIPKDDLSKYGQDINDIDLSDLTPLININITKSPINVDGVTLSRLEIKQVAGDVNVKNSTIGVLGVGVVSGNILVENSTVYGLATTSISGKTTVKSSSVEAIVVMGTSGDIDISDNIVPKRMEVSSVSSSIKIALPQEAEFTLTADVTTGKTNCEFEHTEEGDKYIVGGGENTYNISTTSGSVTISPKQPLEPQPPVEDDSTTESGEGSTTEEPIESNPNSEESLESNSESESILDSEN